MADQLMVVHPTQFGPHESVAMRAGDTIFVAWIDLVHSRLGRLCGRVVASRSHIVLRFSIAKITN
jgi:hypothetical protein